MLYYVAALASGLVAGAGLRYYLARSTSADILDSARRRAHELVEAQRRRARQLREVAHAEARTAVESAREALETYAADRSQEFAILEGSLRAREEIVKGREQRLAEATKQLTAREGEVAQAEAAVTSGAAALAAVESQRSAALTERAETTPAELREHLVGQIRDAYSHAIQRETRDRLEYVKSNAEKLAKRVIDTAVQRYTAQYVIDRASYALELPGDEMRVKVESNGEWLAAIATARGLELALSEDNTRLVISGQDFVNREIVRRTLTRLIERNELDEQQFHRLADNAANDVRGECRKASKDAARILRLAPFPREVGECVGKLRFRTSYTQNQWSHAIEVGFLCGLLAAELGLDQNKARRAGLMHDIGKTVDHEVEGPHAVIGASIARKEGEDEEVANAVGAHHNDEPPASPLAYVVTAGDSISGGRPGARHERSDSYVDRVSELERIPRDFRGVTKVYALQAGREVRVFVDPRRVTDSECVEMSQAIARRIEEEMTFPGQIQVMVIRETVAQHVAA